MRRATVFHKNRRAGLLIEEERGRRYSFVYDADYGGESISLAMPVKESEYRYDSFPPFFDGLLPEGPQLESLLRQKKIDADDLFSQLCVVGEELPGAVNVREIE